MTALPGLRERGWLGPEVAKSKPLRSLSSEGAVVRDGALSTRAALLAVRPAQNNKGGTPPSLPAS
jgi:hypothetical protein